MRVAALVLGAGRGERLGHALPKAFVPVAGRPLIAHALEALAATPEVDLVVPVVAAADRERFEDLRSGIACGRKLAAAVEGGEKRQDSVWAGLQALPEDVGLVAVHDAARPLVRPATVSRVIEAARIGGAAILAVPVADTIKHVKQGVVTLTPPRDACWAAQTPQVFRVEWLAEALENAAPKQVATDCAQLVENLGVTVHVVEGDVDNLKITRPEDLARLQRILEPSLKIGQGVDAHRLVAGLPLRLGGVEIPHPRGLEGHSDGDVLLHAVASALLGALGAGDLGTLFPSSDPALAGIESGEILRQVAGRVRDGGHALANLDATVIAQEPRLAPHLGKLRSSLAALLDVPESRVNVKITSTDQLGAIGRGEGIAAQAVVLLEPA